MEPDAELEAKLNETLGIENNGDDQPKPAEKQAEKQEADPVPAEGEATPDPDTPADKPADPKPDEAKPPAEPDIYAPLPEHNPRKTQERFRQLIEGHKEAVAKVKEYEPIVQKAQELEAKIQEHERGWEIFREMGYTDEGAVQDLQQFSQYRSALQKQDWRAAKQILQGHAQRLAMLSGEPITADPLSEDLRQGVSAGTMDEVSARELARLRYVEQQRQTQLQAYQQQQERAQEQQNGIHQAAQSVDGVVRTLMRDPDYARVEPELIKQLGSIKQNYPPQMWAQEVKRAYETEARFLRMQVPATPARAPLRPTGHGGGGPVPRTVEEAVLMDLGLPMP